MRFTLPEPYEFTPNAYAWLVESEYVPSTAYTLQATALRFAAREWVGDVSVRRSPQ